MVRLQGKWQKFRSLEWLVICYLGILTLLILVHLSRIPQAYILLLIHFAIIGGLYLLFSFPDTTAIRFLRYWYVVPLIIFFFKEIGGLVPHLHSEDVDQLLIDIDQWLFGEHPTIYLERFVTHLLTEFFQLTYSTFYFLPVLLGIFLYSKKKYQQFEKGAFAVFFAFAVSYLGYILMPSLGPRFWLEHLQTVSLHGVWSASFLMAAINCLEGIQRDCFPSAHTMVALVTLYYFFKFERRVAPVVLPIVIALVISTVYCRYHYVIDVIVGMILVVPILILVEKCFFRMRCW